MSVTMFLLVAGYWILLLLPDAMLRFGFFGIWLIFLYLRLKKPVPCAVWLFLAVLTLLPVSETEPPGPGTYIVMEVHSGYVIAVQGKQKLLFQDESADIHDMLQITETEPLESLRNIGLFDFSAYMKSCGVTYRGSGHVLSSSGSLQARIMKACRSSPAKMSVFYGIREQESLLDRAGLPVLSALIFLESRLKRRLTGRTASVIAMTAGIVWGTLFLWPAALVRWLLFRFFRTFTDNRLNAWSLSVFCFLLLLPDKAAGFSLVLPALLQLMSILHQKTASRILLLFLQGLYFGSLSLWSLLGFRLLRQLALVSFFLAWVDIPLFPVLELPELPVRISLLSLILFGAGLCKMLFQKAGWQKMIPCFLVMILGWRLDPFFHVYMLDVGQGDCAVIVEPFQKSIIMIDVAGNLYRDNAQQIILPFLKSIACRHLDALVVTHEDFDHSGSVDAVTETVSVDAVIRDPHDQIPVEYPMEILLPDRQASDENEGSILTYFAYDGNTWLWTGDAGIETEKQLMETYASLPVTVLKAGHHGSATASSFEFLDWIRPDVCLLSVGRNNRYGHPSPEVLSSLETLNISRFSTAESGMIHLFSWGPFLFLETADGQITCLHSAILES